MVQGISDIAARIQKITSSATGGLTAAQKAELHGLFAARVDLDQSIIGYSMIDSMDLNDSVEVKQLSATIANINVSLKQSLEGVNKVVTVVQNLSGLLKVMDSALKAVAALASL